MLWFGCQGRLCSQLGLDDLGGLFQPELFWDSPLEIPQREQDPSGDHPVPPSSGQADLTLLVQACGQMGLGYDKRKAFLCLNGIKIAFQFCILFLLSFH